MIKQKNLLVAFFMLFVCNHAHGMIVDNRWLPLIQRPFITAAGRPSHFNINAFIITASSAFGYDKDVEVGYVELFGPYQQWGIGCALTATGRENPLNDLPFEVDKNLVWDADTKLQSQGFNMALQQAITDWLWVGFDLAFMRVNGRQEFHLQPEQNTRLTPENILVLDILRKTMNAELGIFDEQSSQSGFGDIDAYLRFGAAWDYLYKFQRIDADVRLGVLIPSGQTRNLSRPSSVPFGGDGHWGMYLQPEVEFEVKEDWKVGLWLRASKRFARTCNQRVPVCDESILYGALVLPVRVNPGFTFEFLPYVSFENLREGLGMRVLYTLRYHTQDTWCVQCEPTVPVKLGDVSCKTVWGSDYITLNVFYDFGKVKVQRTFDPIVYLAWDIPAALLVTQGATKANKITVGVEFNF